MPRRRTSTDDAADKPDATAGGPLSLVKRGRGGRNQQSAGRDNSGSGKDVAGEAVSDKADDTVAGGPVHRNVAKKDRPTPKRRDAEAERRRRMTPPKTRKEALKRQRESMRTERSAQRQALLGGDDKHLPARDRGPVRRFVRDFIDSRRCMGEFLLPFLILILILSLLPAPEIRAFATLGTFVIVFLVIVDSVVLSRRLKKELRTRFPDENLKGTTSYLVMRSMNIRRMRLPKPRVKAGDTI